MEDKGPFAGTVVNTFGTNGSTPFSLIRKTLLLTGAESISGLIGKELSAFTGRNLVLFLSAFLLIPFPQFCG